MIILKLSNKKITKSWVNPKIFWNWILYIKGWKKTFSTLVAISMCVVMKQYVGFHDFGEKPNQLNSPIISICTLKIKEVSKNHESDFQSQYDYFDQKSKFLDYSDLILWFYDIFRDFGNPKSWNPKKINVDPIFTDRYFFVQIWSVLFDFQKRKIYFMISWFYIAV